LSEKGARSAPPNQPDQADSRGEPSSEIGAPEAGKSASGGGLTAAVLRYYRVCILAVAGLLIYGLWVYVSMARTEDPEFEASSCRVVTLFPGASAEKVEVLLTRPLEDAIDELDGIGDVISTSSSGLSMIDVYYDDGEDADDIIDRLRERLNDEQRALPAGVMDPEVLTYNTSDIPVVIVSLYGTADYAELKRFAEQLEDQLEAVSVVSKVEIEGLPERQILVDVDNNRISQYRIPLLEIRDVLRAENVGIPGGDLEVGQRRFLIKNPNEFESLQDVRDTVIGGSEGGLVYLRDVAQVTDGFEVADYRVRTNGANAVLIAVNKRDNTNTIAVSKRIRRVVSDFEESLPEGLRVEVISDRGEGVQQLLGSLTGNAIAGGIIVVLMVTFFLGFRQAAVVSVSIPLSFLIAFILMNATGVDLNQVSIFGLVLALGMLVDSSLVVIENIGRQLEEGKSAFAAVTSGVDQVKLPVLSSTLTTVAAFIPMLAMTGDIGSFIRDLPLSLMYALFGSVVAALTIIPLLCYPLFKNAPAPTHQPEPRFIESYTALVKRALRNRGLTLGIAGLLFVISVLMIPRLGLQFFPEAEKPFFLINIRLPRTASLEATDLITAQVEALLGDEERVRDYTVNIGKGSPRVYYNELRENLTNDYAQIVVNLDRDLRQSTEDFVAELQPKLRQIAGATVEAKILEQGPSAEAAIQVRLIGPDLDVLSQIAIDTRTWLADVEGLVDLRDTLGAKIPRLDLDLDRTKAGRLGLDSHTFSSSVFAALNGEEATRYRDGDEEVPVIVRLDPRSVAEVSDLLELYVPTAAGDLVAVREVATVEERVDFARLARRNGQRVVTVEMDVQGRLASEASAEVAQRLEELTLPEGYLRRMGGENEDRDESFGALARALVLAVLLIYAILAIQFNSFVQPFVILLTVPFGVVGAVFGLYITGRPFGFMAFIGIVSLTGIIINDSIVLTDFTNYLMRERGMRMYEALLEAGRKRFRPVVLTSVTTIVGLTPMAIFGDSLWSPLACAVIFGLMAATVLILVILPVIFSLLVDPKEGQRTYRNWRRLKESVQRPEEPT
jgi:multidrug efflux pump subunit AcrB